MRRRRRQRLPWRVLQRRPPADDAVPVKRQRNSQVRHCFITICSHRCFSSGIGRMWMSCRVRKQHHGADSPRLQLCLPRHGWPAQSLHDRRRQCVTALDAKQRARAVVSAGRGGRPRRRPRSCSPGGDGRRSWTGSSASPTSRRWRGPRVPASSPSARPPSRQPSPRSPPGAPVDMTVLFSSDQGCWTCCARVTCC